MDHGETKEVRGLILEPSFLLLVSEAYPDKHGEIRDAYSALKVFNMEAYEELNAFEKSGGTCFNLTTNEYVQCAMCNIRSKSCLPAFVAHVQHQLTEEKSSPSRLLWQARC